MSPSSLSKKVKAKLSQLHVLSRMTSHPSSPSSVAPGTGKSNDTPDGRLSQKSLLSTYRTLFGTKPVVKHSKSMLSQSPESSSHIPSDPEPNTSDKLKKSLGIAWKGLETALRLLERSADAFPPLKSAVGELVALLDL